MASDQKRIAEESLFTLKIHIPRDDIFNNEPKTIAISSCNSKTCCPDDCPLLNITCSNLDDANSEVTVKIKKIASGYKFIKLNQTSSVIEEKIALIKPPSAKGIIHLKLTAELYEKKGILLASGFVELDLGCRKTKYLVNDEMKKTTKVVDVTLSMKVTIPDTFDFNSKILLHKRLQNIFSLSPENLKQKLLRQIVTIASEETQGIDKDNEIVFDLGTLSDDTILKLSEFTSSLNLDGEKEKMSGNSDSLFRDMKFIQLQQIIAELKNEKDQLQQRVESTIMELKNEKEQNQILLETLNSIKLDSYLSAQKIDDLAVDGDELDEQKQQHVKKRKIDLTVK